MLDTKTPTKRKSMGASNFTPGSNKKVKMEPGSANKSNIQGTPKVKSPFNQNMKTPKGTPNVKSPFNQNTKTPKGTPSVKSPFNQNMKTAPQGTPQLNGTPKSGKKGKKQRGKSPNVQTPQAPKDATPNKNNTNGPTPKGIGKVPMFSGTATLDKTPITQANLKSSPQASGKKNKQKTPAPNKQVSPKAVALMDKAPGTLNHSQRKRLKTKLRKRTKLSEQFAALVETSGKDPKCIEKLTERIAEIKARKELTTTAKRKLTQLTRLKKSLESGELPAFIQKPLEVRNAVKRKARRDRKKTDKSEQDVENKLWNDDSNKAQKINVNKSMKKQEKVVPKVKTVPIKKPVLNQKKIGPVPGEESDDDSVESDYNAESAIKVDKVTKRMNDEAMKGDSDSDEADSGEEEADAEENSGEEEADSDEELDSDNDDESGNDDDDDDSDDEGGSDDDGVEDIKPPQQKKKLSKLERKQHQELKQTQTTELVQNMVGKADGKGKSRYVVFVGNLPYDITTGEIKEHFEKKVPVKHVRLATEKGTNKPRGFGYVEATNEDEYQRLLSFHHTFLKERRINVLFTKSGSKNGEDRKDEIKVKNMKLTAMRQKGMLAGSVKDSQRRAARRNKRKSLQKAAE